MSGQVVAVSSSGTHTMSKPNQEQIHLLAGLGVAGDAHQGETVKHRSRVKRDPTQPNLRQVHLIHAELHDELRNAGFALAPGQMGENVTTRGIDLLGLPVGTRLHLGETATVEVTGLRNPCAQLDGIAPGLDGGHARPRRERRARAQGGDHGDRAERRRRETGRSDPHRTTTGAALLAGTRVISWPASSA